MSVPLSITMFLPLAAGLAGAVLPRGWSRWLVLAATVAVLALAVWMVADYPAGASGLRNVTDQKWIPELGIRYSLGVDGLNLFLIALTALLWVSATFAAALRDWERPRAGYLGQPCPSRGSGGRFRAGSPRGCCRE